MNILYNTHSNVYPAEIIKTGRKEWRVPVNINSHETENGIEYIYDEIVMNVFPGGMLDNLKLEYKLNKLAEYDKSSAVNEFYFNEIPVWIDRESRTSIMNTIQIEKSVGKETTELWLSGFKVEVPCDLAIQMLHQVELYAKACYNTTEQHKAAIKSLTTVEEINNYDITTGYPEKLHLNYGENTILN